MDRPALSLPGPDRFERLVTIVDAALAPRGWHAPHVLIHVTASAAAGEIELGLKDLPDVHPASLLWGFEAPPQWLAMGLVTFGWAAPDDGQRPSKHPRRVRSRATTLVTREGRQVMTASLSDGTAIDEPCAGLVDDVLRRCLGLATAPPPPLERLALALWLEDLRHHPEPGHLLAPDALDRYAEPTGELSTWERVRRLAACRPGWREAGEWMDDGFFARHLLAGFPSVSDQLAHLDRLLAPSTVDAVRARVSALLDPDAGG